MKRTVLCLCLAFASTACAQLSTDQKVQDFRTLSSLYAKQYAPYEWKKQLFNYDLFKIGPWLDRVTKSKDDLEFYEIMAQYVASLNDIHSSYFNPSNFEAYLGFRVDIYDNKTVIDFVNRQLLSSSKFPFQAGDELVMVDGRTPDDYVKEYAKLVGFANPRSTNRFVTNFITDRIQAYIPRAEELGDTATVVIRRQSGNLETYMVPWSKFGTPLTQNGPVPTPQATRPDVSVTIPGEERSASTSIPGEGGGPVEATPYLHPMRYLQTMALPNRKFVRNLGLFSPIFALPTGFRQRLGSRSSDFFFSGTYQSGGKTIGFIRIPDFSPVTNFQDLIFPEAQFDNEIAYLQQNTDALVLDVTHNPGGFGCYAEDLMSRLAKQPFHGLVLQLRPTLGDVQSFNQTVIDATDQGAEDWQINLIKGYRDQVVQAFSENRGDTGPLPVCGLSLNRDPNTDVDGNLAIYDKPVLLLTDEFTISAGDFFTAMFQDAQRGKIIGWRTSGAGGSINAFFTGFFSEGQASVTQTLGIRANPVVTSDYPTAPLIENIGVRPDIPFDYQTTANLLARGKIFTDAFTAAVLKMLQ